MKLRMHRALSLVALLIVTPVTALAQILPVEPTPQEIDAIIGELKSRPISNNQIIAYQELQRVEALETRFRSVESRHRAANSLLSDFQTANANLQAFMKEVAGVNCANADAAQRITGQSEAIFTGISFLDVNTNAIDVILRPLAATNPTCGSIKTALSSPALGPALAGIAKEIQQHETDRTTIQQKLPTLGDAIRERREAVTRALQAEQTRAGLQSWLWAVILVIGGLSIAAIWVVKTFPIELQLEWVTSGQVIQFVTVMILLSVIMALGLSEILKENTLGTLLGGIAGYVLSQGVGRAAAQAATKAAAQSASTSQSATRGATGTITP